jgi:hypothetical protein
MIAKHTQIAAQILKESHVPPSDQLPYSPEFNAFRIRFCKLLGREITYRDVWKTILNARKRGIVGASRRRRHVGKAQDLSSTIGDAC